MSGDTGTGGSAEHDLTRVISVILGIFRNLTEAGKKPKQSEASDSSGFEHGYGFKWIQGSKMSTAQFRTVLHRFASHDVALLDGA